MLSTITDIDDTTEEGEFGEMLLKGCTSAGIEVVVCRRDTHVWLCNLKALGSVGRMLRGKRQEWCLGWPARTSRMALGTASCASDISAKVVDCVGDPQKRIKAVMAGRISRRLSEASAMSVGCRAMKALCEDVR
jgi:hypothetical protein